MKKGLFIAMIALIGLGKVNAQEGSSFVGVNIGLPTGVADNISSIALSVEFNYLFEISDAIKIGPSISYLHFFGEEIPAFGGTFKVDDFSFLPLAAAGRFSVSEEFVLGLDLGYAIGVSPEGNEGGFYYRPLVGYLISERLMIQATYAGITKNEDTASNLALGVVFSF